MPSPASFGVEDRLKFIQKPLLVLSPTVPAALYDSEKTVKVSPGRWREDIPPCVRPPAGYTFCIVGSSRDGESIFKESDDGA